MRKASLLPFLAGLFCGLLFITMPVVRSDFSHVPGDLSDARFCMYLLEHDMNFLSGKEPSLWDAPFLVPEEKVITYSENLVGTAPFYALFRALGADRYAAFNCWYVLLTIFNYSACFLLLSYLIRDYRAAACGAMIFAFSIALHSQIVHAQTFARFPIPLAFYFALHFARSQKPLSFLLMCLMVVYQFYCGIYMGLMLCIAMILLFSAAIVIYRAAFAVNIRKIKWGLQIVVSLLISLSLLYVLMDPYMDRSAQVALNKYEDIFATIPPIRSYFFCLPGALCWDFLKNTGIRLPSFWDHWLFPGGIAWAGILISAISFRRILLNAHDRRRDLVLMSFVTVLTFFLFVRIGPFSGYKLVSMLPGYGSMRSITRIINIELLFFALGVALSAWLLFRSFPAAARWIFPLLVFLIAADNYLHPDFISNTRIETSESRVAGIREKAAGLPATAIISYEPDSIDKPGNVQLDGMLAAQDLGLKCLNGYTSTSPEHFWAYWMRPDSTTRMEWLIAKKLPANLITVIKN